MTYPKEWWEVNPNFDEDLEKLLTATRRMAKNPPRGYRVVPEEKLCYPVPEMIKKFLVLLADVRYTHARSLRDALQQAQRVCDEFYDPENGIDYTISSQGGLSNLLLRFEKELNLTQKETTADRLKKIKERRWKEAMEEGRKRPTPCLSSKEKKKREKRKKLTAINEELKLVKAKEKRLKTNAARHARGLGLKKDPTKIHRYTAEGRIHPYYELYAHIHDMKVEHKRREKYRRADNRIELYNEMLASGAPDVECMAVYKEIMAHKEQYQERSVAFLPTPRQYRFLAAPEDIVLYGGAAGGGKSYSLLIDPLRYAHMKAHNAVLIRKTMPELNELIDTSRELYPLMFPKARFKEVEHAWYFPSGAKIRFGYLDKPADKFKYQGKAFTYIGFDELSQHTTDEGFTYLRSRLRRTDKNIYPYIRATANPGSQWVYDMFIAPSEPETPFILPGTENTDRPLKVKFIPAKLEDNPHLDDDGMYRTMLMSLPEVERRQLLEGDWLASNDNMFPEFDIRTHVCEPFYIPKHWNRVSGLDYGYRDPSAGVWFAVNPEDQSIVVYDEFVQPGLTGKEFALAIKAKEAEELVHVDHPIDWSVFARTGHTGPTIAESMLSVPGFRLRRADKNREAGWVQIHEYLRKDPRTGAPKIQVFSTCKNLIRQLVSAKVHKTKPGDLDDTRTADGHWDLLDALRYGIMSRPRVETLDQRLVNFKSTNRWAQVNDYFSL
jgi:hypothetical protein